MNLFITVPRLFSQQYSPTLSASGKHFTPASECKICIRPFLAMLKEARYIFTELACNGDLFSYIHAHGGTLEDANCRVIVLQLILALQYMHEKQIAHRDIKPENVFITQTGFGGRVVLADFGFANWPESATGRLKSYLGTTGFQAP
jgi:serine/threonine protein kinase